jgi:AraC-like DNA-binding protein
MGERTFQRRLRDQSLSFHAIVEEVRRAAALRLLDDSNLNRDEVALLLGYSEASSFRRALRRWTAPPARSDDAALG